MIGSFNLILLATAILLSFTYNIATTGYFNIGKKLKYHLQFIFIYLALNLALSYLGLQLGYHLSSTNSLVNLITFSIIIIIFAFKIILSSLQNKATISNISTVNIKNFILISIYDAITTFCISIAIGVLTNNLISTFLIINITIFIGIILFYILGSYLKEYSKKLRFGPIGGILMIILAIIQIIKHFS